VNENQDELIAALSRILEQTRLQYSTLTYVQAADAVPVPAPYRIHTLTMLLEALMDRDAADQKPLRAALVISRRRNGLPADGFFIKAEALGLFDGTDPGQFHQRCLDALYNRAGAAPNPPGH